MRIHHVRVEAFGPFASEVTADLDALSDAGLFLLTGATGAGKTSVLDAICFALYGAVPGDRQGAKRLRSDHAADGVAPAVSLEFTVQGRRFRIDRSPAWTRPKKRGSGLTTEQASVLVRERIGGEWHALSTRLDEAGHLVTGLLGMNLTQFCQVQLLPQGRFQAFLRADSHERHQLLQQLFCTSRFEDVETWLRERRRGLRRESARHHDTVADLVSRLSEAAEEPLPDDWDPHDLHPVAGLLCSWSDSLVSNSQQSDVEARDRVARANAAAACAREQLDAGRRLAECQHRLTQAQDEQAALIADELGQSAAEQQLDAGRRGAAVLPVAEVAAHATQELRTTSSLAETDLARAATLLATRTPSLEALREGERQAIEVVARAQAHEPRVLEREELRVAVAADAARAADVTKDLAITRARLAQLPELIAGRRTAEDAGVRAKDALAGARRELAAAQERRNAGAQVAALVEQRLEAEDLLRQAVDHAQAATQEWLDVHELRLIGMAAEIAGDLAVGACCPVCGSAEHPHLAPSRPGAPDAASVRAARKVVDDAEVVRHARSAALTDLHVRVANAQERSGHLGVTDLDRTLAQQQERVAGLQTETEALSVLRHAREAAEQKLQDVTRRCADLAAEEAGLEAGGRERRARISALESELDTLLSGTDHLSVESLAAAADEVADACASAARSLLERDRVREAADAADRRAEEEAAARGFSSLAQAREAALESEELLLLEQQLRTHRARLAAVETVLADPDLVAAAEADAADLTSLESSEGTATSELAGARDLASIAARRRERLERLKGALETALACWGPLRAHYDVTDRLASLADGTAPDNRLRMRLSGYVLAFRLGQVVSSANERLVAMTDGRYRLEHTGERGAGESRGGLSLLIRDDWSGEARDPVTLSGGETFVVSLALALGLADVIAHEAGGAELDTLFVDEGFGTLDADTLDDVMNTLDSLRDGGRVVGVVSHVAELRDRIPMQLHVRKCRSGSTLHQDAVG